MFAPCTAARRRALWRVSSAGGKVEPVASLARASGVSSGPRCCRVARACSIRPPRPGVRQRCEPRGAAVAKRRAESRVSRRLSRPISAERSPALPPRRMPSLRYLRSRPARSHRAGGVRAGRRDVGHCIPEARSLPCRPMARWCTYRGRASVTGRRSTGWIVQGTPRRCGTRLELVQHPCRSRRTPARSGCVFRDQRPTSGSTSGIATRPLR